MAGDDRWSRIGGEGIAWGIGAFAASVVTGAIVQEFRDTVGLENVTLLYLGIVIVAAAFGGRAAGLLAALTAAVSYNFFFTTPYHTLRIDSVHQVVTVVLLFTTGILASMAGRTRRRSDLEATQRAEGLRLLNAVTEAVATGDDGGGDADQIAARGLGELLGARRVTIRRAVPDGEVVAVDLAEAGPDGDVPAVPEVHLDARGLPHLDHEGRLPEGFYRVHGRRLPRPPAGVVATLTRGQDRVGELAVVTGPDRPVSPAARLLVATVAHALAAAPRPHAPTTGNGQQAMTR